MHVFVPRIHLLQVDPDVQARASVEEWNLQRLQLVSDILMSELEPAVVNRQVHPVDPLWMGEEDSCHRSHGKSARGFLPKY
jgi:hypothetical protein